MNNNEFYVGWMQNAPASFVKHINKVLVVLGVLVTLLAIILTAGQRKFSTSNFESGRLTEIRGIYQQTPVPSLRVIGSPDAFGHYSILTIPLVGYGKFGAEGVMQEIQAGIGKELNNRIISLKGTLLYSDGKTLLQVDGNDKPLTYVGDMADSALRIHRIKELGKIELKGEILDPKCYFGVMKPGNGKPHRDCAIRCIEGGMSPVFRVLDENGNAHYYLLLGSRGEKINHRLKDFVADPVLLSARARKYDDWDILYFDAQAPIRRIAGADLFGRDRESISCAASTSREHDRH